MQFITDSNYTTNTKEVYEVMVNIYTRFYILIIPSDIAGESSDSGALFGQHWMSIIERFLRIVSNIILKYILSKKNNRQASFIHIVGFGSGYSL